MNKKRLSFVWAAGVLACAAALAPALRSSIAATAAKTLRGPAAIAAGLPSGAAISATALPGDPMAIAAGQGSSIAATAAKTLPSPVALATGQEIQLDVPYVPTRVPVVEEMLKMAGVTKADIVYDLGCGDGRIVITAAQRFGCRGVGFDIDPERIRECLENAKKAGVTDRVNFIEGDLFQADFHEATVLPMYLLTTVNLKLRPKILRELQPGSRVVSPQFRHGQLEARRPHRAQGRGRHP